MEMSLSILRTLGLSIIVSMTVCAASHQKMEINTDTIIGNYTTIATANYADAVKDAESLEIAINDFAKNPTQENLEKAKKAWLNARESMEQVRYLDCQTVLLMLRMVGFQRLMVHWKHRSMLGRLMRI